MRDVGLQDWEIAQRMGIKLTSLVRQIERHNLPLDPTTASMAVQEREAAS